MDEIINLMDSEKNIIEQLINCDNDKMGDNMDYNSFMSESMAIVSSNLNVSSKDKLLFITEGDPLITLKILKSIEKLESNVVIFINQGYIGLNKWLISRYKNITGNNNHEIDFGINYNKYIGQEYRVIPIGESNFKNVVMRDFYE